ncbi:MAG TPA: anti-sigma factor [Acetobacteraceae bacterium]|jgi:anti-sigma factor RsiW
MADPSRPVTEEDLHAYVDGLLPSDRHAEIARYLQDQPELADRVAAYIAQREGLRLALAGVASEPIPPHLDLQLLIQQRLSERRTIWRAAAAVLLAFVLGGAGGWAGHAWFGLGPSALTELAEDAVANHVVYTADRRRPTELGAEQRQDLARWVSNRLNHVVAPPDMSDMGYHYMGGRLAATPQGPAGLFMYQDAQGVRLTVFVLPMRGAEHADMRDVDVGGTMGCAWIDKGIGYTVVAPVPAPELRHLADHVREQLASAT